jgi:CBS domain-containing protein
MSAGRFATRVTYTASPVESVRAAAARMRAERVGTLVVLDEGKHPVGMLTDRDVTVRCVGADLDPDSTRVAQIMSTPVCSVDEDTPIESALRIMAGARVRRCVVLGADRTLVGLLALDDVLDLLSEEVEAIGALVREQAPG